MFEAFKIGVKISLMSNAASVLGAMATQLTTVHGQASGLNRQFTALELTLQRIKNRTLIGGAMAGAGIFGLSLLKGPLDEAKKFEQQMGKFKLFGMSDAQNAEAQSFARNMNIMGSSARENLKIMTEAQGIFRESGMTGSRALEGAKLAAPYLAKINFASSVLDPESAAKMKHSGVAMMRFVEMSGGLDPKKFKELANMGFKLTQTSGGAIDWEQMRQFKARSGIAGQYISEEGMAMLEPIIGELKGSTAGFAKRTAFNRLNGIIKIPNQAAQALLSAGIWDAAKVTLNSQGGIKSFSGNPLKDSALMMKSPVEFYEKNFKPMYDKANMSPEERGRNNAMYFGSTGGMLYTLIDKQMTTIHHSLDSYRKAKGIDESYGMAGKTLAGKEIDLHAKWKNLMLELGTTILPIAIKAVEGLTSVLKSAIGFAKEFPTLTKGIVILFGVLAAAVAVGGVVALATAAFSALGVALGFLGGGVIVTALGAVFTALGAVSLPVLAGIAAVLVGLGFASTVKGGPALTTGNMESFYAGRGNQSSRYYGLTSGAGGGRGSVNPGDVYLDGRKVGKVLTDQMARGVGGAQTGSGRMDKSMMPYRPGMATR